MKNVHAYMDDVEDSNILEGMSHVVLMDHSADLGKNFILIPRKC